MTFEEENDHDIAGQVEIGADTLTVYLTDGRVVRVPLAWYPRLLHGTPEERNNFEIDDLGMGIHWPDLDEDLSVAGLVAGVPSGETEKSLQRWLKRRARNRRLA